MRDSRQIQRYQKCVIRDISKLNRLKNSVKHQETVKNTRKQCETEWNSHRQRHLWFPAVVTNTLHSFTPPFTKFSTRIFTPVGKSLHEHRSHRSHLFASLSSPSTFVIEFDYFFLAVLVPDAFLRSSWKCDVDNSFDSPRLLVDKFRLHFGIGT